MPPSSAATLIQNLSSVRSPIGLPSEGAAGGGKTRSGEQCQDSRAYKSKCLSFNETNPILS